MPTYCFVCEQCGVRDQRTTSIADRPEKIKCPCGTWMHRDYGAEQIGGRGFEPFWSSNCGMFPQDIKNYCKKHEIDYNKVKTLKIDGKTYDKRGNVHVASSRQWREALAKRGFVEAGELAPDRRTAPPGLA